MAHAKKTTHVAVPASNGRVLALQFLARLRRNAINSLTRGCRIDEEAAILAEKLEGTFRLPVDQAAQAIALAYCLSSHFPTVEKLKDTNAFVVIRCRTGDQASRVSEVLIEAIPHEAGEIAYNPQSGLHKTERIVVVGDAGALYTERMLRAIAQAAQRSLPVFCVVGADNQVPGAFTGAELMLEMPAMSTDMLALLFEQTHDQVPQNIERFTSPEKQSPQDLVAHIRRAKSPEECLSALEQRACSSVASPGALGVQLKDIVGYGDAKTWALELAQDMNLWRQGSLEWDEVDHRAVVLSGPPGTGKTSFAAILAEALAAPLIASSVAEWNSHKHLAGTLDRMKAVFAQAKAQAPCVLLIDELDGISSRSSISGQHVEYWTQIVNLMLVLVTEALATPGVVLVGASCSTTTWMINWSFTVSAER